MGVGYVGVIFIGSDYFKYIYKLEVSSYLTDITDEMKSSYGWVYWPMTWLPPPLLFLMCAELIPPVCKFMSKYERWDTRTKKHSSYLFKCFFYYLFLHLFVGTLIVRSPQPRI